MNAKAITLHFLIEGRRPVTGAPADNLCKRHLAGLCAMLVLTAMPYAAAAQVVIGSASDAGRAALLELKSQSADRDNISSVSDDANVTSTKGGLLLPRVRLVSPTTLEPFIPEANPDWAGNVAAIRETHAGLCVYNLTSDAYFVPGVYSWTGDLWRLVASSNIDVGSGLTLADSIVELGGTLTRTVSVDNNSRTVTLAGQGEVRIATPLTISGTFKYVDGNQGEGKLLMSDRYGYASWQPQASLPPTPTAVFTADGAGLSANVDLRDYVGADNWKDTNAYIMLPPGRWFVMVTMRSSIDQPNLQDEDWLWLRTTFIAENESLPNPVYFDSNNSLISGRLYKSFVTISGYVIINNATSSSVKFRYHFGEVELGRVSISDPIPFDRFGSSHWEEDTIVAFALVEQ
ncbi:MAG: hypothetical protein LBD21_01145 [Tannerellaceae bacterium]|jgi:hypothetical protein|nr:hypothetical protein [Tannerellaceae bacterium]